MAHSFISKGKVVRNGFPGNRRTRMEKRKGESREKRTSHEHKHKRRKEDR